MPDTLKIRPADIKDKNILLAWRNAHSTRCASHNSTVIAIKEHSSWLQAVLTNPKQALYIAEFSGIPVGSSRADYSNGHWRLSWTIAEDWRGRGFAKQLVKQVALLINEPITAEIKVENTASQRVAEYSGLSLTKELAGILYYSRGALS